MTRTSLIEEAQVSDEPMHEHLPNQLQWATPLTLILGLAVIVGLPALASRGYTTASMILALAILLAATVGLVLRLREARQRLA